MNGAQSHPKSPIAVKWEENPIDAPVYGQMIHNPVPAKSPVSPTDKSKRLETEIRKAGKIVRQRGRSTGNILIWKPINAPHALRKNSIPKNINTYGRITQK